MTHEITGLEQCLTKPFWESSMVYGEAMTFFSGWHGDGACGTFLLQPASVLRVRSSDHRTTFIEGQDYVLQQGTRLLTLPPQSRIQPVLRSSLHLPAGSPGGIAHKAGAPGTWLRYGEYSFPPLQVEVDYLANEPWTGVHPSSKIGLLPRFRTHLQRQAELRIAITGDSISAGENASRQRAPHMPPYPQLLLQMLTAQHGCRPTLHNLAEPRTSAKDGVKKIPEIVSLAPDLLIVAFGMNDAGATNAPQFQEHIREIIERVRLICAHTEFLLITPTRANPEWSWSAAEAFPKLRSALLDFEGPGIAVADACELWKQILDRKPYHDLTGNGINHPNDYGHRLLYQLVTSTLDL